MDFLPTLSVGTLLAVLLILAFLLLYDRDRALEANVHDPRPGIRDDLRAYLGTDEILSHLHRLENLMANATEQISHLGTKIENIGNVTADIAADFAAFRTAMEAERETLSTSGQAALDDANTKADAAAAKLADLDVAIGDADGSDTPTESPDPNA